MEPNTVDTQATRRLARELSQRLDSLRRAGLTDLPRAEIASAPEQPHRVEAPKEDSLGNTATVIDAAREPIVPAAVNVAPRLKQPPGVTQPAQRVETERPRAGVSSPLSSLFEEPGFTSPSLRPDERLVLLKAMATEVASCVKCPNLARTRTQTVFGDGSATARLMFIGEAPGADEDRTGVPFVGRAGQLLTDMITKGMRLRREDVYIANILKCRPPENREPSIEESCNCLPYLERQIEIVRPEFLCLLGRTAVQGVLGTSLSMSRMRGKWYRYKGIPCVVTYHPSYLLRTPSAKRDSWADLQLLMNAMGLAIPQRGKGSE